MNLYAFVNNGPTFKTDPDGRFAALDVAAALTVVIATGFFLDYLWHVHECHEAENNWQQAILDCRKEFDKCPNTSEAQIDFMVKYNEDSISDAIWNCAKKNHPELLQEMQKKCNKVAAEGPAHGGIP